MPRPRQLAAYAAVFLLALLARALYLWELWDTPLFAVLLGDGRQYHAWAVEIAGGDWIGREVFYQAPLYPYFLAAVSTVFGSGAEALRIVQAVLGAASCVLVAHAGRRFFSDRAGLAAGVLLALYPPALFFDGLVQKASLGLFLLSSLLALLGELPRRSGRLWPVAAGAVLGLLALTRENALILVPVLVAWLSLEPRQRTRRERGLRAALFVAGLALLLVPVGLRNLAVGGRFLVTTAQLGPNFYIGNNPAANGRYRPLVLGRQDARVERRDATELAEANLGLALDPGEVSRYWLREALSYVASDPGGWTALLLKKAFLVVHKREVVDTEAIEVYREESRLLDVLSALLHFGVLGPLALFGVWASRGEARRLWVLYAVAAAVAASLVAFYVVARYRFQLVPVAVLFAGAGLVELARAWPARKALVPGLAILAGAAVIQNWPVPEEVIPRATTWYNLGVNLFEAGRREEARQYLEKTVAAVPDLAAGHFELGRLLEAEGQSEAAARSYQQATTLDSTHVEARYRLGFLCMQAGRLDEAARLLREVLAQEPRRAMAHNLLGNVLASQGRLDEAVSTYEAALRIDSGLADAHFKLGLILSDAGRYQEARRHLAATLRLAPGFAEAERRLAAIDETLGKEEP